MDFNRTYIERRDFPPTRRGYDPDAVDRHLREVADTVEELQEILGELQAAQRPEPQSLSGAAAEQVRLIIEAAEGSAGGIEDAARLRAATIGERAAEIEEKAHQRAAAVRQDADAAVEERIARVEGSSDDMLRRTDALEGELASLEATHQQAGELLSRLVAQAAPLRGEIESMRGVLEGLRGAGTAEDAETLETPDTDERPGGPIDQTAAFVVVDDPDALEEPVEVAPAELEPLELDAEADREPTLGDDGAGIGASSVVDEPLDGDDEETPAGGDATQGQPPDPRGAEEEIAPTATPDEPLPAEAIGGEDLDEDVPEPPAARRRRRAGSRGGAGNSGGGAGSSGGGAGDEGARLVALNMALNGTPRDETDRYLAENFELADRQAVLDDVYARVG